MARHKPGSTYRHTPVIDSAYCCATNSVVITCVTSARKHLMFPFAGGITWNEFQVEFLVALGKDRELAMKSNIDDENLKISDKGTSSFYSF